MCHFIGPEGVARGEDALTMLENPKSRSQFIDELMEVKIMHNSYSFTFISDMLYSSLSEQKDCFLCPPVVTSSQCMF